MIRFILVAVLASIWVTAQSTQANIWLDGAPKGVMFEWGPGVVSVHNELTVGTESEFVLKCAVRFRGLQNISHQFEDLP